MHQKLQVELFRNKTLTSMISPMFIRKLCSFSTASLNATINKYVRDGRLIDARKLLDENQEARNITSWNSVMAGYVKNDRIRCAQQLFDEMPDRDVVTWNTMIAGFRWTNDSERVIRLFMQMERIGLRPTEFTLTTVIGAISGSDFIVLIPQLHARVVCFGFNSNGFVGTSLIGGYANFGDPNILRRAFDEISPKNVPSWNALISGYMCLGCVGDAHMAFKAMPEKNIVSWTSLVNGYILNKNLDEARRLFNEMPERNVVSWTAMISGYEQNGRFIDAIELFISMQTSGIQPNQSTFSTILSASAGCSSLLIGKQIHLSIWRSNFPADVILSSSLVDMYAKCGRIDLAIRVFEFMPKKNLISWNSIIGGYARHGLSLRALEQFDRMKINGIRPDYVTFVNVLSACGHGGLIEEGERHFASMEREFGVRTGMEHYGCMVDLYGRAGHLEKAEKLIKSMPFEPDIVVWGALLGACGLHSNYELGLFAAESIFKLELDHPVIYSMLSKILGSSGVWKSVVEMREMMKEMGAKKQKGSSWIETSFSVK